MRLGIALAAALFASGLAVHSQPANDAFANRASLSGTNVTVSNSLAYATHELDEPLLTDVSSGQTAWWTWTPPANGIVTLSASSTSFTPLLTIYTGNELTSLTLVATNNYVSCYENCGCHWQVRPQTTFHVAKGTACQIAVDSAIVTSATYGLISTPVTNSGDGSVLFMMGLGLSWTTNVLPGSDYRMSLQLTPAPANDDFAHPIMLHGARTHIDASNAGATEESGEPNHLGNGGGSSVWYAWRAPASGRVTIATNPPPVYAPPTSGTGGLGCIDTSIDTICDPGCGSESPQIPLPEFYPVFAAYTGASVNALASAGTLSLSLDAYPHAVCFDAVQDQTYHIAFDGNQGTTGGISLYLSLAKPASNDNFWRRIRLRTIYAIATGYNAGATHQTGEPAAGANSVGKTVWWTWTAPVSGATVIDLRGSDFSFPIGVFTGGALRTLMLLTNGTGSVSFDAVTGQTYQIAVSDSAGLTGSIQLALKAPVVTLNLKRQTSRTSGNTLLQYDSQAGQRILLQRSSSNVWTNVQTVLARSSTLSFLVRPAPGANGPYYRAIVVDRKF
jgi:hypothetical protein